MPLKYTPGLKIDWRQRLCGLTKRDLLEFDHHYLEPKFPDLFRYEWSRAKKFLKLYDTLAEVDREVQLSEVWPEDVPEIVFDRSKHGTRLSSRYADDAPSIGISVVEPAVVDLRKVEPSDTVHPIDFIGHRFVPSGQMCGCYPRGDKVAQKFFGAVFRLSAKFMTNSFEWYNLETGKFVSKMTGSVDWSGPDGIRLGRQDPNFYVRVYYCEDLGTWCGAKAVPRE